MIESCVHTHTTFCDGNNSPAEMADKAYNLGLKCLGFSGHSYVAIDDFGMKPSVVAAYCSEVERLKNIYLGKMDILCGIEFDSFSDDIDIQLFDYIIASAHAVQDPFGNCYIIDGSKESFCEASHKGFDGDFYKLCNAYYEQFSKFVLQIHPTIVGHYDLVTKFNEGNTFYNESCSRYIDAAMWALDEILKTDSLIEINTGGISRGYRKHPYPSSKLLNRILEKKGRVIITTDAHDVARLTSNVIEAEDYLREIGFKSVCEFSAKGIYERAI